MDSNDTLADHLSEDQEPELKVTSEDQEPELKIARIQIDSEPLSGTVDEARVALALHQRYLDFKS